MVVLKRTVEVEKLSFQNYHIVLPQASPYNSNVGKVTKNKYFVHIFSL